MSNMKTVSVGPAVVPNIPEGDRGKANESVSDDVRAQAKLPRNLDSGPKVHETTGAYAKANYEQKIGEHKLVRTDN